MRQKKAFIIEKQTAMRNWKCECLLLSQWKDWAEWNLQPIPPKPDECEFKINWKDETVWKDECTWQETA